MIFDESIVAAVTRHMNDDHPEDNILLARAFGVPEALSATMTGLDENAGRWAVVTADGGQDLDIAWPSAPLSERRQIRQDVVTLYREACARLGIEPRPEHEEAPSPHHHAQGADHAHSHHSSQSHPHLAGEGDSFAQQLRNATWSDHGDSEGTSFMADIMRGRASREDYIALVAQHYYMYEVLEEVSEALWGDERYAGFHPRELLRKELLVRDLKHLLGEGWREQISALPATEAYTTRMREVSLEGWVPGIVAHHYTRYLGDLSGGQYIAKRVGKQFGFSDAGIAFYDFGALASIAGFKESYRTLLDALGEQLDDRERALMTDEVRDAYRHNTAVFADLEKYRLLAAS